MSGRIVILSGPSGVGKDTVIDRWKELDPRVERVVAYTTRTPRTGEMDGVDYHFVTRDLFEAMASAGKFLEWKEVHCNFYATPLADMEAMLAHGKVAILKIDVQGGLEAMELRSDAISIFLEPPSWDELERRIRARGSDDPEVIERRLQNARDELAVAYRYKHRLVNDELEQTVAEIRELVD